MNEKGNKDFRVLVVECPEYNVSKIQEVIYKGMETLNYKPFGKVAIKPNVVCAFDERVVKSDGYTNKEVVEATIRAVFDFPEVFNISITETSAVGNPTRFAYQFAGYTELIKRLKNEYKKPINLVPMDEDPRISVFIGGNVHNRVRLSRTFHLADTKIYVPKLKCHCVSKMTAAVKMNIGSISFDDRSIRHDFLLDEKIADLLSIGYPDFIILDAIKVGVGNEAVPLLRQLGLLVMGKNPVAVDLVASRLLGLKGETDVPYLRVVIQRGYKPERLEEVELLGDAKGISDLERFAERIKPYDDEFYRWQDIEKELRRLHSPMRLFFGPYSDYSPSRCETGCVMGLKMYLGFLERYAGEEAFARARPCVFVIGRVDEPIDAKNAPVFLIGSCTKARVENARRIVRLNKCFVTASDMFLQIGNLTGIKSPFFDLRFLKSYVPALLGATAKRTINGRYFQDILDFFNNQLMRKF